MLLTLSSSPVMHYLSSLQTDLSLPLISESCGPVCCWIIKRQFMLGTPLWAQDSQAETSQRLCPWRGCRLLLLLQVGKEEAKYSRNFHFFSLKLKFLEKKRLTTVSCITLDHSMQLIVIKWDNFLISCCKKGNPALKQNTPRTDMDQLEMHRTPWVYSSWNQRKTVDTELMAEETGQRDRKISTSP